VPQLDRGANAASLSIDPKAFEPISAAAVEPALVALREWIV
jgi:hypothetical protein